MRVELNILDYLRRAVAVYGDRVAMVDSDTSGELAEITYASLERRANTMAARLEEMGVGVGQRVAILSPNASRFMVAFFGVSGHGRVLVPINYRLNRDEVAFILEHSGVEVLLIDPEYDAAMAGLDVKHRIALDGVQDRELFADTDAKPLNPWAGDEDATASINYTSGTTARPKGVRLTHRGLWINAAMMGWQLGVNDRDVYLHTLPMFHCNGWGMPYCVSGMGGKHVNLRAIDGEEILARIEEHGVTLLNGAPAVVQRILEAAAARRADGRHVPGRDQVRMVVAGAPPPTSVIAQLEDELGWEFIQIYGLTETSPLLTMSRRRQEWDDLDTAARASKLVRAGAPAIGVDVKLSEDGEILARSNHVFDGYWEQPEQTAEAMDGGWFRTGDGAIMDGPYVVVTDRKKDVIISGGENVSSIEVEDCLYEHPDVAECAVIGVPDENWGETVKALVIRRPGTVVDEAGLIDHCRDRMAHYKCPTSADFVDVLPRTATGKLQKFRIRAPYWKNRDRQVS
ncbi:MAG: fatty-acyl-CoA synthase [Glaciecola sp.]|jgi:fatty-acyl-CoA synthase